MLMGDSTTFQGAGVVLCSIFNFLTLSVVQVLRITHVGLATPPAHLENSEIFSNAMNYKVSGIGAASTITCCQSSS
jgi:hypothetical protein